MNTDNNQKIVAEDIAFIDPINCKSVIGYTIIEKREKYRDSPVEYKIDANVYLSDCNRHIEWGFTEYDDVINKVEKATAILNNFKKEIKKALKEAKKKTELENAKTLPN